MDIDQAVVEMPVRNKNALSHKNNLKQRQNGSRSCKSRPKNTNVALQTINETTNGCGSNLNASTSNTISVGSQASETDSSETIPKRIIGHDIHEQSHSMPPGSSKQQGLETGLETGSLGSPQPVNYDLVNKSQTPLGYSRSQGLGRIRTSGESANNQTRSLASTDKSSKSQSTHARNLLSKYNPDIDTDSEKYSCANGDNDSDEEPDERTKFLTADNYADKSNNENSRLLEGYIQGAPRMNSNIGIDSCERPPSTEASSVSGRSERPEIDGQPSSLGSSLSGSSREPVEHDDELVPEHDIQDDVEEEVVLIKGNLSRVMKNQRSGFRPGPTQTDLRNY